jgi:hypothetical protein
MKTIIVKDDKLAALFGVEGYVGEQLLKQLTEHEAYKKVLVYTQKPYQETEHPKIEQVLYKIDRIQGTKIIAEDLFVCFDASFFNTGGTHSIPSKWYRYIPQIAWTAHKNRVNQIALLSSHLANPDGLFFTNRIRGLIEESIKKIGFWGTHIFRPSFLLGEELQSQWGEDLANRVAQKIDRFTGGFIKKNRPVSASSVAEAMIQAVQSLQQGVHIYSPEYLQDFSQKLLTKQIIKKKNAG